MSGGMKWLVLALLAFGGWWAYKTYFAPSAEENGSGGGLPSPNASTEPESSSVPAAPTAEEKRPFYKWTDAQGVVHYTNLDSEIPDAYRTQAKSLELPDLTVLPQGAFNSTAFKEEPEETTLKPGSVERAGRVVLYGASWCPNTRKTRELLDKTGVTYAELDVERDVRALRAMMELNGGERVIPVLAANGTVVIGYKPEAILAAVKEKKEGP